MEVHHTPSIQRNAGTPDGALPNRRDSRQLPFRDLVTGVIATATTLTTVAGFAISMAVLIFSGEASGGLPRAAGAFAVAGGAMSIWIALRSQVVPIATTIQDGPGMVVAALAAGYAADERTQVLDVFVLLALTTVLSGAALWLLGYLRLGTLVRCMPTTVVGGFVAGTGWLLFKGGFDVMVATTLGLSDLARLFEPELGRFWLPGLVLGLGAWGISHIERLPAWTVGVTTLLALIGFYLVSALTSSVASVEAAGWLIGPFPESSRVTIISVSEVTGANWHGLLAALPGMLGVAGLTATAMLLNVAGITSQLESRVDLNHELRITGIANMLVSPLGSTPGFHSLGATALLDRLDVRSRAVPCGIGLVLLLFGLFGVKVIGYVPRIIPGGLLIFLGMSIMQTWVTSLRTSGNTVERALSIGIVLVTAWMGILPGIAAGLLAACAGFILRYSKVDPVRIQGTGASHQSLAHRTTQERATLHDHADRLAVFELQGYLFFGSLASLERRIRSQALSRTPSIDPVDTVILDFKHVTGIETSATEMVKELMVELEANGVRVLLSALSRRVHDTMGRDVSLDAALEHWENQQLPVIDLRTSELEMPSTRKTLSRRLYEQFQRVHIEPGDIVVRQGQVGEGIFIIESGSLTAYRFRPDLEWQRVRQIAAPDVVGEITVTPTCAHPATVVADTPATVLWMANESYHVLRHEAPDVTAELHEFLLRRQTEQIVEMSEALVQTLR